MTLSPRQTEILQDMAEGLTSKDIARKRGIHIGTVKSHAERIFIKLGAHCRTTAVIKGIRAGILEI